MDKRLHCKQKFLLLWQEGAGKQIVFIEFCIFYIL